MRKRLVLLMLFLPVGTLMANDALHPAAQIAAAEIAFARQSVDHGLNSAFAANFADDAVDFAPLPRENARQYYVDQPNPPVVLDWYPAYTLAAASGDFGLSTGPFTLTDPSGKRPSAHGHYISIWRKQADGQWKVVIDGGTTHPALQPAIPALDPAQVPVNQLSAPEKWQGGGIEELVAADIDFSERSVQAGIVQAFREKAAGNVRLYRDGAAPLQGRDKALAFLEQFDGDWRWEPKGSGIASSGDLGFTYGVSTRTVADGVEQGAYLRVWQRTANGWQVILSRDNPVPPRQR